ncbi:MAG TPA: tRNA lysidine(34) synthetase TilS [Stellaceae bacterium]|nr:tRNA lysidine(34) synthetase TilS [Stellaceae bacterium]
MAAAEPPLTEGEFAALVDAIGGFEPQPLVAVAVSGGPDSMALAILADRWARSRGGAARALIVDHRLRPDSAAEAQTVAGWLAARGIAHAVLAWDGDKPASGIQEAARAARYRLLATWCAARGCLHLLTAHHREDQAETYLIRRRARSGPDGLAGMSAVRELAQLRLVRPLLGVPRARLAALLAAERQPSVADPSNRDPAYERVRLRGTAAAAVRQIGAELREHAAQRLARERQLAALLAAAAAVHPAGLAVLDPAPLVAAGELGERALGRVAALIGGAAYPLRRARLARLRVALGEIPPRARTLGGCRFVPWRGRVLVLREAKRAAPPLTLAPGMSGLWDRRFALRLPADAPGAIEIGPLGSAGAAAMRPAMPPLMLGDNPLPRLVYPALPALRDAAGLAAVPHLGYRRAGTRLPETTLRPAVSLFEAGFTVV